MWLFTKEGFFSIVQDRRDSDTLWVRSRDRQDLVRLLMSCDMPDHTVSSYAGTDYEHRTSINREDLAKIMQHAADAVDYTNFKDMTAATLGRARAEVYSRLWWEIQALSDDDRKKRYIMPWNDNPPTNR